MNIFSQLAFPGPLSICNLPIYRASHKETITREMRSLCLFLISSPQTVGVIIRLDRDMFSVLNQHGKVSSELP